MDISNRRSWAVVIFTALLIIIVNLTWWLFYAKTEQSFENQLSRRLASIAQLGAARFDPELVSALMDEYLWAYDKALDIIEDVKASDSLSEVFVLYADRKYLATTSLFIGADSTYYLEAINRATIDSAFSLERLEGWAGYTIRPAVTVSFRVGDLFLKSAFAPLVDTSGIVAAVLGVEADVDYTDALLDLRNNLYLSSGVSVGVGILFGIFFFFIQRRIHASEKSVFLSQSQANLGRMVAVVSHEIKNPLMIIRASAESLRRKTGTTESSFILEEIDRLDNIVTGYLDFASGKKIIRKERIDMVDSLAKIVDQFGPRLAREGIHLKLEAGNETTNTIADPVALRQVIINLILNGAEATEGMNDRTVTVGLKFDNNQVRINVTDSGPGIDKKRLNNIFEPFYTTKTTGSGLGLFHSRRLMEAMEGSINVESKTGGPTTFTISLPVSLNKG